MSTLNTTNIKHPSSGSNNVVLDSSARVLVGTSSVISNNYGGTAGRLQVANNDYLPIGFFTYSNTAGETGFCPYLELNRARGAQASPSAVGNGDDLGLINFYGHDGATFIRSASIKAVVDGTPGTNDMPGRIILATTADGASSPTERMRIDSAGTAYFLSTANTIGALTTVGAGTSTRLYYGSHSASGISGTISYTVWSNGNVVNTNNSYGSISDIKLKENIVDAGSQWGDLKALQVRKYNLKAETGQETHTQIGLVAQEVELVSPGLVSETPDRDKDGNDLGTVTKSVTYSVLYMKAVKALQEAMERIEQLEQRLTDAGIA
jgi:hypothetical protein